MSEVAWVGGGVGASLKELRQPASASERPRQMETFQKPRFSGPHHHRAGGDHDYGAGAGAYLIIVIFFTLTQSLENKIYTQKTRKLRQNTQ